MKTVSTLSQVPPSRNPSRGLAGFAAGRSAQGAERTRSGRELHPLESSAIHGALFRELEPMIVHFGEKLTLDRISRNRTDDRINTALRAKRRIAIVSPVLNLVRRKHFKTVEAAAEVALPECRAIVARPFVGADVVFRDGKFSQGTIHVSLNAFPVALVLV
jgi:hypothetical protein